MRATCRAIGTIVAGLALCVSQSHALEREVEIIDLLKITFSALKLNKEINLNKCASKMQGLSYALVVKIANDAAKKSIINSSKEISVNDLDKALEENLAFNK